METLPQPGDYVAPDPDLSPDPDPGEGGGSGSSTDPGAEKPVSGRHDDGALPKAGNTAPVTMGIAALTGLFGVVIGALALRRLRGHGGSWRLHPSNR